MSDELARKLVEKFEGLRLDVYLDSAGFPTVGYGHLVHPADALRPGQRITQESADELLEHDMAAAIHAVDGAVKVPLNDNERAALISLAFNIGIGAFRKSTLLRKLNAGDFQGAADQFLVWDRAGGREIQGLKNRRAAEREVFLEPVGTE